MHMAVTRHVEAKKLLSCWRQSEYRADGQLNSVAQPALSVGGGGQSERPLPFLPHFSSFSQFFPSFSQFSLLLLNFSEFLAIFSLSEGHSAPLDPPSGYANDWTEKWFGMKYMATITKDLIGLTFIFNMFLWKIYHWTCLWTMNGKLYMVHIKFSHNSSNPNWSSPTYFYNSEFQPQSLICIFGKIRGKTSILNTFFNI